MHISVRALAATLAFSASFAVAPSWAAPYVWVTAEDGAGQAHVGELLESGKPSSLPELKEAQAVLADGKEQPVQAGDNGFTFTLPQDASGDVRFTAKSLDSKGVLTIYGAKYGRSETKAVNDLELVPTEANGSKFHLVWKGKPVTSAVVSAQTSAGWRQTLQAGPDGVISLTIPEFPDLFPSRYVLNATVKLNGEAILEGKAYDQVRYSATLTFDVPK